MLSTVFSIVKKVLRGTKTIYIPIRYSVGSVFGEKVETFYKKHPEILLFLISNKSIGKVARILNNNSEINVRSRYNGFALEVTPLKLAILQEDTKVFNMLMCYGNVMMKLENHEVGISYRASYGYSDNQTMELYRKLMVQIAEICGFHLLPIILQGLPKYINSCTSLKTLKETEIYFDDFYRLDNNKKQSHNRNMQAQASQKHESCVKTLLSDIYKVHDYNHKHRPSLQQVTISPSKSSQQID